MELNTPFTNGLYENDLRERFIWVVNDFVGTTNKYSYLEKRTGISARKWRNICNRTGHPNTVMLKALAIERPYFATWLLTGKALGEQINPITNKDWQIKYIANIFQDTDIKLISDNTSANQKS